MFHFKKCFLNNCPPKRYNKLRSIIGSYDMAYISVHDVLTVRIVELIIITITSLLRRSPYPPAEWDRCYI